MERVYQPKNLDEAVDYIVSKISDDSIEFFEEHENAFISELHFSYAMDLRNDWNLWWYEDHKYETWPKSKPDIVQFFNDIGIYHADDMSGIICTTTFRKYYNKPIKLEEQIKVYQDHWLKYSGNINPMLKK